MEVEPLEGSIIPHFSSIDLRLRLPNSKKTSLYCYHVLHISSSKYNRRNDKASQQCRYQCTQKIDLLVGQNVDAGYAFGSTG